MPLKLFLLLKERLNTTFATIANVQLSIESEAQSADGDLVMEYWRYVVEEFSDMAPPLRDQLLSQVPEWNGSKLMLCCSHEHEMMALKSKYTDKLSGAFQQFGFPRIAIEFQLAEGDQEAAHLAFMEQRRLEEIEMASKALADMKKRETDRKENGVPSGPFQMGVAIKPDEKLWKSNRLLMKNAE
nr:hypothetical protein [Planococcus glaciei]